MKSALKALKVKFEAHSILLPTKVTEGIEKSLQQHDQGQTLSFDEFKSRNFKR